MSDKRTGKLKEWTSTVCLALDDLEKLFQQLINSGGSDEEYTQREYLLQELGHLRDAVSETTEDDLEVEQIEG